MGFNGVETNNRDLASGLSVILYDMKNYPLGKSVRGLVKFIKKNHRAIPKHLRKRKISVNRQLIRLMVGRHK